MKRKILIIMPVTILVVGFFAMQSLLAMRQDPPRRAPQVRPKLVEARVARLEMVSTFTTGLGRVVSAQPVALYSEVAGKLQRGNIDFVPAQSFRRGDLLLKVDDRSARLDLNSAISELLTALATAIPEIKLRFPDEGEKWQAYFDSIEFDSELPQLPEAENQKIKLYLSRYNVYRLYYRARNLEITLSKHYIHAPFDGSVVSTGTRAGSSAGPGTFLGNVINLEEMEVEVPISAEDLNWIDYNRMISLTSLEFSGEWSGRISRIGSSIDDNTQTVPVYIDILDGEDGLLLNGAYMEAKIPGISVESAIRIPRKALYSDSLVYLVDNGKLVGRPVGVARYENEAVLISEGIQSGDTIVVEVLQGISPDMPAVARIIDTSEPEAK